MVLLSYSSPVAPLFGLTGLTRKKLEYILKKNLFLVQIQILEYIQFQYQLHKVQQHSRYECMGKQDKCLHCVFKILITISVVFLQRFRLKSLTRVFGLLIA